VGVGLTIILTEEITATHGAIPVVVSVKTAVPAYIAGGVQVALGVFAFGVKVPPVGDDHVPPVAEPPIVPVNVADPPWQMV